MADALELSPGFFHPPTQPDAGGVFTTIRTFERSLVPARRASVEPLYWPDGQGDTHGYFRGGAALKAAITELGLDANQAAALRQQLVAADKAAQAAGIAFKSQDAPEPTVYTGPDGAGHYSGRPLRGAQGGGPTTAARGARRDEGAGDEMGEDPVTEDSPEDLAQDADYLGDMTVADFEAMLQQALAPLIKGLDIAGKLGGHVEELKGMMSGVATKEAG